MHIVKLKKVELKRQVLAIQVEFLDIYYYLLFYTFSTQKKESARLKETHAIFEIRSIASIDVQTFSCLLQLLPFAYSRHFDRSTRDKCKGFLRRTAPARLISFKDISAFLSNSLNFLLTNLYITVDYLRFNLISAIYIHKLIEVWSNRLVIRGRSELIDCWSIKLSMRTKAWVYSAQKFRTFKNKNQKLKVCLIYSLMTSISKI